MKIYLEFASEKTKYVNFSRKRLGSVGDVSIRIDNTVIIPSFQVRFLGVILDSKLSFVKHCDYVCDCYTPDVPELFILYKSFVRPLVLYKYSQEYTPCWGWTHFNLSWAWVELLGKCYLSKVFSNSSSIVRKNLRSLLHYLSEDDASKFGILADCAFGFKRTIYFNMSLPRKFVVIINRSRANHYSVKALRRS